MVLLAVSNDCFSIRVFALACSEPSCAHARPASGCCACVGLCTAQVFTGAMAHVQGNCNHIHPIASTSHRQSPAAAVAQTVRPCKLASFVVSLAAICVQVHGALFTHIINIKNIAMHINPVSISLLLLQPKPQRTRLQHGAQK